MNSDLFAAIRKHDTGVSTSYLVDNDALEHVETHAVFQENPQKTAPEHVEPPEHAPEDVARPSAPKSEPRRYVTVAEIKPGDTRNLPEDWRTGLDLLNAMPSPEGTTNERWAEIIRDAHRFAWGWARDPAIRDWSLGSMIGFDPNEPEAHSLILDIRGGRVVHMFKDDRGRDCAIVARREQRHLHRRQMHDDAEPLWAAAANKTPRKRGFV